jgi:hypothetical protein
VHETEDRRIFTVLDSWVRSDGEEKEEASSVSFLSCGMFFMNEP